MARKRVAFTLVELLVVIAILAMLIAMLMPALGPARASARQIRSASAMRQLLTGYTMYHIDHRGAVLYGYTPATVNGVPITVRSASGHVFGVPVAERWPWRLAPYVPGLWPIVHDHHEMPPLPAPSDSNADAMSKAYTLSLSPAFGINSVYVGGHAGGIFKGFIGDEEDVPNTGAHVVFNAAQVRQPARLIAFAECRARNAVGLSTDAGFHYVTPPRANGRRWTVENGGFKVLIPGVAAGLPEGRNGMGAVTGFFDAHVESLQPAELEDMRLWANYAKTTDYDFVSK